MRILGLTELLHSRSSYDTSKIGVWSNEWSSSFLLRFAFLGFVLVLPIVFVVTA
jgi:hypothetical protein